MMGGDDNDGCEMVEYAQYAIVLNHPETTVIDESTKLAMDGSIALS
jgi:hypothetical protein